MTLAPTSLTKSLVNLALQAGREIMAIYATDFGARTKSDLTPVTEADEAAERVILEGLARLDPQTPVISEEAASAGRNSAGWKQLLSRGSPRRHQGIRLP